MHRRTLTYRIKRIRELTGLDPTTAHGIQLLRAALTATHYSQVSRRS
ncbi:helix-turn-helix domain-containing protein [Streptomyces rubiginosohelvolus]